MRLVVKTTPNENSQMVLTKMKEEYAILFWVIITACYLLFITFDFLLPNGQP